MSARRDRHGHDGRLLPAASITLLPPCLPPLVGI